MCEACAPRNRLRWQRAAGPLALLVNIASAMTVPATATAELLRFELNSRGSAFPQTFAECEQRLRADISFQVQWADQPWYDPNYSTGGGATVGNITFAHAGGAYTDTLTWLQFDSADAAQRYSDEAASWGSTWYQTRCEGEICLQVYAASGNAADMELVFEAILGRR